MVIEYMKQWTGEYFSEVLQKSKKHDVEYQEAIQKCRDGSEKIEGLLLQTDSPVQDYVDAVLLRSGIEQDLLYVQGLNDCVAILKGLRVLV